MIRAILAVGIGSALGGICRYLIGMIPALKTTSGFPYPTMIVNIAGAALIGMAFALLTKGEGMEHIRLLVITGFLGGFTTFSSFSMDFLHLLHAGNTFYALVYAGTTIVIGFAATWLTFSIFK